MQDIPFKFYEWSINMSKKKDFIEGIDYAITIRKRKKFIKNSKKNILTL